MNCQGLLSILNDDVKFIEIDEIERFEFKCVIPTPTQGHHFVIKNKEFEFNLGLFRHVIPDNFIVVLATQPPFMTLSIVPIKEGKFNIRSTNFKDMEASFNGLYPTTKCIIAIQKKVTHEDMA